jgi:hypothetical protein
MNGDMDWFGVKLLHKITISGIPEKDKLDEFYRDNSEFFEERIILVKASSFDEAYQLAESEAKEGDDVYENKYGQTVKWEFYRSVDCFHLFDSLQSPVEVFSTLFAKKQGEDEEGLLDKRYGGCIAEETHVLRHA